MVVLRKEVKPVGGVGHVMIPSALVGKYVYIVADQDVNKLAELLDQAYILKRLTYFEFKEQDKKLDKWKSEWEGNQSQLSRRIKHLEDTVYVRNTEK